MKAITKPSGRNSGQQQPGQRRVQHPRATRSGLRWTLGVRPSAAVRRPCQAALLSPSPGLRGHPVLELDSAPAGPPTLRLPACPAGSARTPHAAGPLASPAPQETPAARSGAFTTQASQRAAPRLADGRQARAPIGWTPARPCAWQQPQRRGPAHPAAGPDADSCLALLCAGQGGSSTQSRVPVLPQPAACEQITLPPSVSSRTRFPGPAAPPQAPEGVTF